MKNFDEVQGANWKYLALSLALIEDFEWGPKMVFLYLDLLDCKVWGAYTDSSRSGRPGPGTRPTISLLEISGPLFGIFWSLKIPNDYL